jgi:hypothetical protein
MAARTPRLSTKVRQRLMAFPGVSEGVSRFSGLPAYHLGSKEIAHFHDAGEIDVRVGSAFIKQNLDALAATDFVMLRDGAPSRSHWVILDLTARGAENLALRCIDTAIAAATQTSKARRRRRT